MVKYHALDRQSITYSRRKIAHGWRAGQARLVPLGIGSFAAEERGTEPPPANGAR